MDFTGTKILGLNADAFFALIFLLLFIILGIVSFHFYGYVSGGSSTSAFSAGTGVGFALFPKQQPQQQVVLTQPNGINPLAQR